jgi:septum formation protein
LLKDMGKDQPLNLPYPLVLASTSRYRAQLLSQLGWAFETMAPGVDEERLKKNNLSPEELALELSRLKANAVYVRREGTCVIGSDQVCSLEGELLSKPGDLERACQQLLKLQGRTHELLTAVTIISPSEVTSFLNRTTLHMRPLTEAEVLSYLEFDQPFDCAGSYKLESRGIKLFERIETEDHTAIIGLPLIELANVLIKMGYPV